MMLTIATNHGMFSLSQFNNCVEPRNSCSVACMRPLSSIGAFFVSALMAGGQGYKQLRLTNNFACSTDRFLASRRQWVPRKSLWWRFETSTVETTMTQTVTLPTTVVFEDTTFDIVDRNGTPWLRGLQVASALGFKNPDSDIANLYERNKDEFTSKETCTCKLQVEGQMRTVRIFSPRGAWLCGMLARTKPSKKFRRWNLDVLENLSLSHPVIEQQPAIEAKRKDNFAYNELFNKNTQLHSEIAGLKDRVFYLENVIRQYHVWMDKIIMDRGGNEPAPRYQSRDYCSSAKS